MSKGRAKGRYIWKSQQIHNPFSTEISHDEDEASAPEPWQASHMAIPRAFSLEAQDSETVARTLLWRTFSHHNQFEEICGIASFFLSSGILDCHFL